MTLPFENDTSRIIRRITSAHLEHDKLKTVITIFAITLTTSLMSSILPVSYTHLTLPTT